MRGLVGAVVLCVGAAALTDCATGGGYNWQAAVAQQASFDHRCPMQNVAILRDNGDPIARAVEVNVCGQPRMYRDIGGTRMYLWQDTTEMVQAGTGQPSMPVPGVAQPMGPVPGVAQPVGPVQPPPPANPGAVTM